MKSHKPRILTNETDYTGSLEKVKILKELLNLNSKVLKGQSNILNEEQVIALYGAWGSGKSSVITTLENDSYIIKNYKTILFEAWEYERDNNLNLSLFEMLLENTKWDRSIIKTKVKELYKIFQTGIIGVGKSLSFSIPVGTNGSINIDSSKFLEELETLKEKESKKSFYTEKTSLKNEFQELIEGIKSKNDNKKILIFIDDLDRCENENIISLITSIKHLFTLSDDIIFIITIDKKAITQALKVKYGSESEKADEYLEKIFPLSFSLKEELNLDKYFSDLGLDDLKLNTIRLGELKMVLKDFLLKYNVKTPRKFIKISNKIRLLDNFSFVREIKNNTNANYGAFLYLIVFNLFTLAEYRKEHYDIFFEEYNIDHPNGKYIYAFDVDKDYKNPIYDYLVDNPDNFPDELYETFKKVIKRIQQLT